MDIIEVGIIAYLAVMERRVVYAGMDLKSTGEDDLLAERTYLIMTGEGRITHVERVERLCDLQLSPVGCHATLRLQLSNLFCSK